mgnify:CR=1 FL=1
MIGWIVIFASVAIVAKAADVEQRSAFKWGFLTFIICLACAFLIPLPLINIVIGLVISFAALFAVKVMDK